MEDNFCTMLKLSKRFLDEHIDYLEYKKAMLEALDEACQGTLIELAQQIEGDNNDSYTHS